MLHCLELWTELSASLLFLCMHVWVSMCIKKYGQVVNLNTMLRMPTYGNMSMNWLSFLKEMTKKRERLREKMSLSVKKKRYPDKLNKQLILS